MYSSAVDRYRLIAKLIRAARADFAGRGIDQTALARRAHVAQSSISALENLDHSLGSLKRHVGREELLKVLAWGLGLPVEKTDAILWLYNGRPLQPDEIRRYVKEPIPKADPAVDRTEGLRRIVLDWLREVVDRDSVADEPLPAKVRIFYGSDNDRLRADRALIYTDRMPGQRFIVAPFPQYNRPPGADPRWVTGARWIQCSDGLSVSRSELFHTNLRLYGERGIHSRREITMAVRRASTDHQELGHARRWLKRWLELLNTYDHYQVAIAEKTPPFFVLIKSTKRAIIGAQDAYPSDEIEYHWGPRWIEWSDDVSVLRFLLDFETRWDAIPAEHRDKPRVIEWLEGLVAEVS